MTPGRFLLAWLVVSIITGLALARCIATPDDDELEAERRREERLYVREPIRTRPWPPYEPPDAA